MRKVTSDKLKTCMLNTVICKLEWKIFYIFRQTFIDGALGKTKYYTVLVKFKFVACLINTVSDGFECTSIKTKAMWMNVILVHAYVPNENENHDLHELVKLYQLHKDSKTCSKYRNDGCRFHFARFYSNQTYLLNLCHQICQEI